MLVGSREWTETRLPEQRAGLPVTAAHVEAEARRRKHALKLDEWEMQEYVTGRPVPERVRHLALQIEFAAKAIGRLSPIPADFADDVYWPHVW